MTEKPGFPDGGFFNKRHCIVHFMDKQVLVITGVQIEFFGFVDLWGTSFPTSTWLWTRIVLLKLFIWGILGSLQRTEYELTIDNCSCGLATKTMMKVN